MKFTPSIAVFLLIWCPKVAAQERPIPAALHLLDAVNSAMSQHPDLDLQRQGVEIANALQRQASAAFDAQ